MGLMTIKASDLHCGDVVVIPNGKYTTTQGTVVEVSTGAKRTTLKIRLRHSTRRIVRPNEGFGAYMAKVKS